MDRLYIVTSHSDYYPQSGIRDWRFVTESLEEAQECLEKAYGGDNYGYIIRLEKTSDGWVMHEDYSKDYD